MFNKVQYKLLFHILFQNAPYHFLFSEFVIWLFRVNLTCVNARVWLIYASQLSPTKKNKLNQMHKIMKNEIKVQKNKCIISMLGDFTCTVEQKIIGITIEEMKGRKILLELLKKGEDGNDQYSRPMPWLVDMEQKEKIL